MRSFHGGCGTPEYETWKGMRRRCYGKTVKQFADYGGRGIKVCEHWEKFENFLADMGRRPSPQHSIDRINNDGDYEPENCRWATRMEQCGNRSYCRYIALEETDICLAEFCRRMELNENAVRFRLRRGWPLEQALWGR